jgi:TatD DNase family protein
VRAVRSAPPAPEALSPLIDAHTHLDACGATDAASVHEIVDRAASAGVGQVVTVADDLASARWVVTAADADERVWAATALHPTRANKLDQAARTELEALARHPRTVAVGETGLDHYWPGRLEGCADVATQEEAFRWHVDLAKRVGKPVMIHDRDAHADVLRVLREEGPPETVVFHCFSGDAAMARECVDAGYVLSFSGTVSFRNARDLQEAALLVPLEQLLVETDAPFLTPHPHRGRPNESYLLPLTARALAVLRGQDPAALASATTATAERVYGL